MKTIKIMWFAMLVLFSTALQAQVIEFHRNDFVPVSKEYMNYMDSMVYIPAQNWDITAVAVDTFYTDKEDRVRVIVRISVGPDAHMAKAALGNNISAIDIANDSVPTVTLQPGITQAVAFALPDSTEVYTVTVVTKNNYNFQNNEWDYFWRSITVDYPKWAKENAWKSLGKAIVVDDFFTAFFNVENVAFEVEIQESKATPGFYRLVNAYTSCYPYNSPGDYDGSENEYMEIHAENPDRVYISQTIWSTNWGYGNFITWSMADYYMQHGNSPEDVAASGYFGTLKDGVITFPANSLIIGMSEYNEGGLYQTNSNGLFSVQLPDTANQAPAKVSGNALKPMKVTPASNLLTPSAITVDKSKVNPLAPMFMPR